MKRVVMVLLVFLLWSCANKEENKTEITQKEETTIVENNEEEKKSDVDLSNASTTIAYAALSNLLEDPEAHIGESIKMLGTYQEFESEGRDDPYHVCMVSDVTNCCALGLEFVLAQGSEYPENGQEIIVEGVIDSYEEYGEAFLYLKQATYKIY